MTCPVSTQTPKVWALECICSCQGDGEQPDHNHPGIQAQSLTPTTPHPLRVGWRLQGSSGPVPLRVVTTPVHRFQVSALRQVQPWPSEKQAGAPCRPHPPHQVPWHQVGMSPLLPPGQPPFSERSSRPQNQENQDLPKCSPRDQDQQPGLAEPTAAHPHRILRQRFCPRE